MTKKDVEKVLDLHKRIEEYKRIIKFLTNKFDEACISSGYNRCFGRHVYIATLENQARKLLIDYYKRRLQESEKQIEEL